MKLRPLIILALTLVGCGVPQEADPVGELSQGITIPAPSGMGRYCSMTWPGGGWAFASYSNLVDDPCAYITSQDGGGGTIAKAGLYSTTAVNDIVLRCESGGYIQLGVGTGQGPLTWAWNQAQGHSGCTFTVSPREMPIFGIPYDASGYQFTNTGMDHARGYTVDTLNELGDPNGSTASATVDWKGHDESSWGYDNHQGWDFNMSIGNKVYAAADGVVLAARYRDVTYACPGVYSDPNQGEVYIQHTVSGGGANGTYDETFVSYYAHFKPNSILVSAGQIVHKGDLIGYSGTSGCSTAGHLHFSAFRLSNTASAYRYPLTINTNFANGQNQNSDNGYQMLADPRGFYPAKGFDPWAWRGYPYGALSPQLWITHPPDGSW